MTIDDNVGHYQHIEHSHSSPTSGLRSKCRGLAMLRAAQLYWDDQGLYFAGGPVHRKTVKKQFGIIWRRKTVHILAALLTTLISSWYCVKTRTIPKWLGSAFALQCFTEIWTSVAFVGPIHFGAEKTPGVTQDGRPRSLTIQFTHYLMNSPLPGWWWMLQWSRLVATDSNTNPWLWAPSTAQRAATTLIG